MLGWMDGVNVTLGKRRMMVEVARKIGRSERTGAYISLGHFCLVPVFFLTALPHFVGLLPGEGWDAVVGNYKKAQQLITRCICQVLGLRGVCRMAVSA